MKRGRNRSFASQGKATEDGNPVKSDRPDYRPRLKCGHCGHIFFQVIRRTWPDGRKDIYCKSCGKRYCRPGEYFEELNAKSRAEKRPANIF